MGNNTTVGTLAGLAPVAVIVEALLAPVLPDVPAGTISAAFLAVLAWILPPLGELWGRALGSMGIIVLLGIGLSGCSATQGGGPTAAQCAVLEIAATEPMLVAKCEAAPDPLKDEACISISVLRTAWAVCMAQIVPAPPPAAPPLV